MTVRYVTPLAWVFSLEGRTSALAGRLEAGAHAFEVLIAQWDEAAYLAVPDHLEELAAAVHELRLHAAELRQLRRRLSAMLP